MTKFISYITAALTLFGCTQQSASEFLLSQQQQTFGTLQKVNTKIDMLWVIDSSGSMEPMQAKVRAGIQQFAQSYMKPTWDIHVASITTDAYLAHPSFWAGPANQTSYLTSIRPGTANYSFPYLNGTSHNYGGSVVPPRSQHYYTASSWANTPAFTPPSITYNSAGTEKFLAAGLRIIDTKPQLGPNWAKLLAGNHDGPQLSMCWDGDESSGQFIYGVTQCYRRDDPANSQYHTGITNCASPAAGESGTSQCVNTFANNTVHTGKAVISTLPPLGTLGDQTWINSLIADFQVNLTPSTIGNGSERPFQSVIQFLNDNESDSSTRFFRQDSLRVIVFVGDEDDQSQIPDLNQFSFGTGGSYGQGTKAHYIAENASAPFTCKKSYSGANNGYFYPSGDSGYCVDPAWLLPVATVKQDFDNFFHQLDGTTSSLSANYFVAAITTMNTAGLGAQGFNYIAQRYPALVTAVGNGSLTLDITQSDYTPLLNQVGQVILQTKAAFQLDRAPTSKAETIVSIVHADGTVTVVTDSQYSLSGATLTLTDLALVGSLASTDQLSINYQPNSST